MIYICRRGRENLRDLKQDHFQIYKDSDGREYVAQARDELTKKTREDNRSTRTDGGRFYVCESGLHCTERDEVCDLLGSCLVGKWAFIPQLHNHQDIYSHMR